MEAEYTALSIALRAAIPLIHIIKFVPLRCWRITPVRCSSKGNFHRFLPYEFKEILFTRWFRGRFDVDNEVAFTKCMPRWVESGKWQLMTLPRFVALQNCTRGFAQIECWMMVNTWRAYQAVTDIAP
ncbi:hypothetical protein IV203_002350 [Nitzschia inconspicua]|uniref:Uncharacterized protein n=1 Tax=Nitzschia inconspicua TaxID=303405 RepID=A0A9K3L8W9_9STRA|nr:hypothetical protein IV203_002350 [Nitzschia inconspicua]